MKLELNDLKYGQMVAIQIKKGIFYKAKYLNYGDYGYNKEVYCVEVYNNGKKFVDYFNEVYSLDEYDNYISSCTDITALINELEAKINALFLAARSPQSTQLLRSMWADLNYLRQFEE